MRQQRAIHRPLCLLASFLGCFLLSSALGLNSFQSVLDPAGPQRGTASTDVQGKSAKSASEIAKARLENLGIAFNEESFLNAVSKDDLEVVRLFLAAGIRTTAKDQSGKTALVLASEKGHADIVRVLIESGADTSPLVEAIRRRAENKKDLWDRLSSISSLATVFASLIIAAIGWYFTQAYNRRQIASTSLQSARDQDLKEQQNRLIELETIEKMIPHLIKGEDSKRIALLAIKVLGNPELATQMAQLYAGEGSVQALQQIAESGDAKEKRQAVSALSNIAVSGVARDMSLATDALGIVFRNYKSSVVKIHAEMGGYAGHQSGTIVTKDGDVLTAGYLQPAKEDKYYVEMWDGTTFTAAIHDKDEPRKLALLKMEGSAESRPLLLATEIPSIGEQVMAIGFGESLKLSAEVGTVQTVSQDFIEILFEKRTRLMGVGGGPIVNVRGECVGIVYSHRRELEQCMRSDKIIEYLDSKGIRGYGKGLRDEAVGTKVADE